MNYFVALNLPNVALREKALSLGYAAVSTGEQVIEASQLDQLVKRCKQSPFLAINPLSTPDYYKSAALIETCKEKQKYFEIPLVYLLKAGDKSKTLFQLRIFLKKCLNRRVPFYFSTRAANEFELKSPREVIAIGQLLGLTYEQAAAALSPKLGGIQ